MAYTDFNPDPKQPAPPTSTIFVWFVIVGTICLAVYSIARACGVIR